MYRVKIVTDKETMYSKPAEHKGQARMIGNIISDDVRGTFILQEQDNTEWKDIEFKTPDGWISV